MFCTECGQEIRQEAKFCTNCGKPFDALRMPGKHKWNQPLTHEQCKIKFERSGVCPSCKFYFTCLKLHNASDPVAPVVRPDREKRHAAGVSKSITATVESESKRVAVFGPNSGEAFSGRSLVLHEKRFTIEGHGEVSAEQVAHYDHAGLLIWSAQEARNQLIESSVVKKCPYCAEDIQSEAVKCRHCGEFLDATAASSRVVVTGSTTSRIPGASDKEVEAYIAQIPSLYYRAEFSEIWDTQELYKVKFNWAAFLFGLLWVLYMRLWLPIVVWIVSMAMVSSFNPGLGLLLGIAWLCYFGFRGNYLLYSKQVKGQMAL